jgi:hypothetical protein
MKYTDVAIVGGGLAGSTAAAMLGRAGIATVLIDPHDIYPFDFRVEKLSGDAQLDRFFRTGIADSVLRSATHDGENWIARFGYLLDKRPSRQFGISYDQPAQRRIETSPPRGGSIFDVAIGLAAITTLSMQALCAAARAGAGSGCAASASVRSRAAGRLRSDSPATCPARYRSACRPCCGVPPTAGP